MSGNYREMSIDPIFCMLMKMIQHRVDIDDEQVNKEQILGVKSFRKWEGMGYSAQEEGLIFGKDRNTSLF